MQYALKFGFLGTALFITTILMSCNEDISNPRVGQTVGEGEGEGQSEGEGEGEGEGDIATEYGALIVESDPIGASITLDSLEAGTTNYTFAEIEVGLHDVALSMPGKVLYGEGCNALPCKWETNLTKDGVKIAAKAYEDLSGTWKKESDSSVYNIEMKTADFLSGTIPPEEACPTTKIVAFGLSPVRTICVEGDGSLSICKTNGDSCTFSGYGQILDNGQTLEFTKVSAVGEQLYRYKRVVE